MKSSADRILDYALGRHFSMEPTIDLSERIAQRWAEGEGGSLQPDELQALGSSTKPKAIRGGHRTGLGHWRGWILAAACLLLLWAAAALLPTAPRLVSDPGPAQPRPWQVQLSEPIDLYRGPESKALRSSTILAGDTLFMAETSPELSLGAGLTLTARGPALFSIERLHGALQIAPLAGELTLAGQPGLAWALNGVALSFEAPSRLSLQLAGSFSPAPRDWTPSGVLAFLREEREADQALLLMLTSGQLGRGIGDNANLLGTGEELILVGGEVLSEEVWRRAQGLIRDIAPSGPGDMVAANYWSPERAREQSQQFAEMIAEEPALWGVLGAALRGRARQGVLNPRFAMALLDLLIYGEEPRAREQARSLWMTDPAAFNPRQVVAMASFGYFEFQRELEAQWALAGEQDWEGLPYAIYAGMEGDARGEQLLDHALRNPEERTLASGEFGLAALALESLGESGAWDLVQDPFEAAFEAALLAGELTRAQQVVLQVEALAALRREPGGKAWVQIFRLATGPLPTKEFSDESSASLRQRLDLALGG